MPGFSRVYRLISKRDYQSVFAEASKHKYKCFIVLSRPNRLSHARLGMIIAKRYVKRAIDRNRVRRIIRESFRAHTNRLKGLDIIVLFRSECNLFDKQSLRENIDQLWHMLESPLKTV